MRIQLSPVRVGIPFDSLKAGDVFNYAGEFYLKTPDGHPTVNAIEVGEGTLTHFGNMTLVFLESATLVIA